MRILSITLFLTLAALVFPVSAQDEALAPAVELNARRGTPNFFAKLNAGQEVRVGYLGGSITAANGWRVKSLKWFQGQYPQAKLSEINAAIGGTGSGLGVFRAGQDVISKRPDLLFVEFAVNDSAASPEKIQCAMEGIVRQTWTANPDTDICFVYTLAEPVLKELQAGKFQRSATAMEGVADHYGIPSIHFGVEVAKLATEGKLIFRAPKPAETKPGDPIIFTNDGVHPTDAGHDVYQTVIVRNFEKLKPIGQGGPHKLVGMSPLRENNWEKAKIVPITESMLKGKWTKLDPTQPGRAKDFVNRLPQMWKTEEPGSSLEFIIEGTVAQAYGLFGQDGGELEIQVGEQKPRKALLFDKHSTYHRLATVDLFNAPTADRQKIKITFTATMPDKMKILSEPNRPVMEKNPEPFNKTAWHVGSLLILGDLAE